MSYFQSLRVNTLYDSTNFQMTLMKRVSDKKVDPNPDSIFDGTRHVAVANFRPFTEHQCPPTYTDSNILLIHIFPSVVVNIFYERLPQSPFL